jgi:tetratricopeptide (TPR) repeat protein
LLAGLVGLLVAGLGVCTALAGDDFSQVEAHYLFGEYDQALQLLERMIDGELASPAASVDAQAWRARCLAQKGDLEAALDAFCRVRELDPEWRPDRAIFPANELELFERALAECAVAPEPNVPVEAETPSEQVSPPEPVSPPAEEPVVLPSVAAEIRAAKTRSGAVMRSVVPGLGQMYKGQRTKGTVLLASALAVAGVAYAGHSERSGAVDDYEARRSEYLSVVTQPEIDAAYARMEDAWDSVRDAEKLRDIGIYALIGVYVYSVIDAATGFPLQESRIQVSAGATREGQARIAVTLGARGSLGGRDLDWRP